MTRRWLLSLLAGLALAPRSALAERRFVVSARAERRFVVRDGWVLLGDDR
jgi:hypothetical protein